MLLKNLLEENGISKTLMEHIINFCIEKKINQIHLEVSSNNATAINLYKNFDFQKVGLRKNYYEKYDGILFTKKI